MRPTEEGDRAAAARMLVDRVDRAELSKLLAQDEDAEQLVRDIAKALSSAKMNEQSIWQALIHAAGSVSAESRSDLVDHLADCLGTAQSQDLVLWSNLLKICEGAGNGERVLTAIAEAMARACVTSEAQWLELVEAAATFDPPPEEDSRLDDDRLAYNSESDNETERSEREPSSSESSDGTDSVSYVRSRSLAAIADALASPEPLIPAGTVWKSLVQSITPFAAKDRTFLCKQLVKCLVTVGHSDSSTWEALISQAKGVARHKDKEALAKLVIKLAEAMASSNVRSADAWKKLLEVTADIPEALLHFWLEPLALCMEKARVQGSSAWQALLDAAARIVGEDRWPILVAASKCQAASHPSIWQVLIDLALPLSDALHDNSRALLCANIGPQVGWPNLIRYVQALEPDGVSALLAAIVRDMKVYHHMVPDTWKLLLDPVPDRQVQSMICLTLETEARHAAMRANGLGDAPATTPQVQLQARTESKAAYEVYALFEPLLWSTFLGTSDPSPAFRRLGREMGLALMASLHHTGTELQQVHAAILANAAQSGTLGLDEIPFVQDLGARIKGSAATIHWNALDQVPTVENGMQVRFCGFPELESTVGEWTKAAKNLLYALRDFAASAPTTREKKERAGTVAGPFKALIQILDPSGSTASITAMHLARLLEQIFGKDGLGNIAYSEALLDSLLTKKAGRMEFKRNVTAAINRLDASIDALTRRSDSLEQAAKTWRESWKRLEALAVRDDFNTLYKARSIYTIEPLDKDAVATLVIGEELSNCLSPSGTESASLIERLVNPAWVPVGLRTEESPVAVAWSVICTSEVKDQDIPVLVVDFSDMKPSYTQKDPQTTAANPLGMQLMNQLLEFLPEFAQNLGIAHVWLGKQRYGRMESFDMVTARTYEGQEFKIVGSQHMPVPSYTDNIAPKIGVGAFSLLT